MEYFLIIVILLVLSIYLFYLHLRMYDDIHDIREYLINKDESNKNNQID